MPLFTPDLRPRLPLLRDFESPHVNLHGQSEESVAVVVDSSVAFLTAYSEQLHDVELEVCMAASAGRAVEVALQCLGLRRLSIGCCGFGEQKEDEVKQFDSAVASLPPLLLLAAMSLSRLSFSERALSQLLSHCPALRTLYLSWSIAVCPTSSRWQEDGE